MQIYPCVCVYKASSQHSAQFQPLILSPSKLDLGEETTL